MSCDGNRGKHFAHVAQNKAMQDTFGSAADAEAALEQIFNTARAHARPGNAPLSAQAEARTKKLFDGMRSLGIKPPTHSASGLPRKDAQFGYAAVHQTLEAIRGGKRLPSLAYQVAEQQPAYPTYQRRPGRSRTVTSAAGTAGVSPGVPAPTSARRPPRARRSKLTCTAAWASRKRHTARAWAPGAC